MAAYPSWQDQRKGSKVLTSLAKLISTKADVTPAVLATMARTRDARLREVMERLVTHLHQFVMETSPTEAEFEYALQWVAKLGQRTNEHHNEVILAADILGISTLVDLINNAGMQGETASALLGPFYRGNAPLCGWGDNIARSNTPGSTLVFGGRVTGTDGRPLAGASLDVWQASPTGFYENQDTSQDDFNLRGRFTTNDKGEFLFRSVKPAGYPVPTDGPVGDLLRAQDRGVMRPAHIHFIVYAPGHKTLITQIFADDHDALLNDAVFGAKAQITGTLIRHEQADERYPGVAAPFYSCDYEFKLVAGTPTFPVPPISGKKT